MQESIFEPFFRVDKSRSRQMGGVGLGLALVREIALLHGGSVPRRKPARRVEPPLGLFYRGSRCKLLFHAACFFKTAVPGERFIKQMRRLARRCGAGSLKVVHERITIVRVRAVFDDADCALFW